MLQNFEMKNKNINTLISNFSYEYFNIPPIIKSSPFFLTPQYPHIPLRLTAF